MDALKARETLRQAKADGYGAEEVRLLVGVQGDAIAAGKLRGAGAIANRLQAPPGTPPLKGWPTNLEPPPTPRRRDRAPSTVDPRELYRGALIRDLIDAGLSRLDAIDEADRRLAGERSDLKQGATA